MKPTTPTRPSDHLSDPGSPHWVLAVIAACAVVMTGHGLGGAWLGEPALGLPTGLWFVVFAGGVSWLATHRPRTPVPFVETAGFSETNETAPLTLARPEASPAEPVPTVRADPARATDAAPAAHRPAARLRSTWPRQFGPSAGMRALSGLARAFEDPAGREGSVARSIADWMDARPTPTRALRVGLMIDGAAAERLAEGGPVDVEWERVPHTGMAEALRRRNLDALVTGGGEEAPETLVVRTREHGAREAAWFDWGAERPISYFSVFPMRLDASRISLPGMVRLLERADPGALDSARRLIRIAALGSRYPARLTLADRLSGRTAIPRGGANLDLSAEALREAALTLGDPPTAADRIAARVASAWIVTAPDALGDAERCELADRVARVSGDEAEVLLRVAAVRLAMLDERLGIDALIRADRLIRQRGTIDGLSHLRLLQAELEHGTFGGMTIGRVAAGICLACAITPADRIAFLRDDLLDDLRLSSYLVGRDREHAILIDVFRQLERNRRADAFGLPAAA